MEDQRSVRHSSFYTNETLRASLDHFVDSFQISFFVNMIYWNVSWDEARLAVPPVWKQSYMLSKKCHTRGKIFLFSTKKCDTNHKATPTDQFEDIINDYESVSLMYSKYFSFSWICAVTSSSTTYHMYTTQLCISWLEQAQLHSEWLAISVVRENNTWSYFVSRDIPVQGYLMKWLMTPRLLYGRSSRVAVKSVWRQIVRDTVLHANDDILESIILHPSLHLPPPGH